MSEDQDLIQSNCAVCGRGLLPGEQPTSFLDDAGREVLVCALCKRRAEASGWLRPDQAAVPGATTQRSRRSQRGSAFFNGLLRGRGGQAEADPEPEAQEAPAPSSPEAGEVEAPRPPRRAAVDPPTKPPPRQRRAAMAGPSLSEAIVAFNSSEARRMVGGLNRSLGRPRASGLAIKLDDGHQGARITVVWELAWYQWAVGPGRAGAVVKQASKGDSAEELRAADRTWNLTVAEDGTLGERPRGGAEEHEGVGG